MATTFGERLKLLRVKADIRMAELAERSGISTATISRLESGTHAPLLETAARIAAALGVSLVELTEAGQEEK
jgi:transcriptional regulator with XRE-family HTH domain